MDQSAANRQAATEGVPETAAVAVAMSEQRTIPRASPATGANGFDVLSLAPILVVSRRLPRGVLALTLSATMRAPLLSVAARARFGREATVEYLGSDRMPEVFAIRPAPQGTKYAVSLAKSGNLPKQIFDLLTARGWEHGRHPAEWRDGCLVVWRVGFAPKGVKM